MSRIKDENYFTVHGWMINRLHLKGTELSVYAIIYGFTQAENQWFNGSRKYLADFCGVSVNTIDNNLANLVRRGLLEKSESMANGIKFCYYRAVDDLATAPKIGVPPAPKIGVPPAPKIGAYNKDIINKHPDKEENIYTPPSPQTETETEEKYPWDNPDAEDAENPPETPPPAEQPEPFKDTLHELKTRINALYRRRETTLWDGKEIAELRKIAKRPGVLDEMTEIEELYNANYEFARRDIRTFLNNWSAELDRARNRTPRRVKGF